MLSLATGTGQDAVDPISLYHRAFKKVTHFDPATNAELVPNKENGWKFELFLQNFLPRVQPGRLGVLTVDRASEFAPVKNADGADGVIVPDSPAMTRQMVLAEHAKWLQASENTGLLIDDKTRG